MWCQFWKNVKMSQKNILFVFAAILPYATRCAAEWGESQFASNEISILNLREKIVDSYGDWIAYKRNYNKTYDNVTDRNRLLAFLLVQDRIRYHNQLYASGKSTYKMGLNHLSDLPSWEFKKLNGYLPSLQSLPARNPANLTNFSSSMPISPRKLPPKVDWRTKGYVTDVKDQGSCGSCWAFSATGSLEGQNFRATGKLVSLSEQNLVDCSTGYGNYGCDGGYIYKAFNYIKANGGIDKERGYPYAGEDLMCRFRRDDVGATDTGFVSLPSGDELKLQQAVATVGPISVAIDASDNFQSYEKGILYDTACSASRLNHGVLAVGYGTDSNGTDYWLVKNSWGEDWGECGYIRMARNRGNNCGIATAAIYPLV